MARPYASHSVSRRLNGDDEVKLHPHLPTRHLHHKANAIGSGHARPDTHFFEEIANALGDAGEILIIGPASAKSELAKHLRKKHPAVGKRIVAVETADHPSDRQIVVYARQHFNMIPPRIATGTTMAALYAKWFMSPLPPKGVNFNFPMPAVLAKAFAHPTDSGDPKAY